MADIREVEEEEEQGECHQRQRETESSEIIVLFPELNVLKGELTGQFWLELHCYSDFLSFCSRFRVN